MNYFKFLNEICISNNKYFCVYFFNLKNGYFLFEKSNINIHDFTDVKNICIISDLQIHKGAILLDHNRINLDIQFLLDFNI